MNRLSNILDTISQWLWLLLAPLMIYGFIGKVELNRENNNRPTWDEQRAAITQKLLREAESKLREPQTVHEKGVIPPPQLYRPGNDDFNIPLEQLLERHPGRSL